MERSRLVRENRMLQEQLRDRFRLDNIVGAHGSMQDVFRIVHKVAASTSTVLIYGESGTGKELVARALHHQSDRRDRPFYAVNVAALPESILEAELFGHEKGAFTGAESRKVGLFEQASGSTLFLDEVGDLKRDLQVKLLRTLQEREILRVGGTERIKVDVRIIAATNQDLERAVREGRFREDLYYRLNVIPIVLPPLRERRTDIPLLVEHFVKKYAGGRPAHASATEALKALVDYDWPGNVRELESVIERALLLAEGEEILPVDLPAAVRAGLSPAPGPAVAWTSPSPASTSKRWSARSCSEGPREGRRQRLARGAPARAHPPHAAVPPGEDPGRAGDGYGRASSQGAVVARTIPHQGFGIGLEPPRGDPTTITWTGREVVSPLSLSRAIAVSA